MKKLLPVFLMALAATACSSTRVTPIKNLQYAATDPDDIVVYLEVDDVPRAYQKLALIEAGRSASSANFGKARKEAAKLGANGVLVQGETDVLAIRVLPPKLGR